MTPIEAELLKDGRVALAVKLPDGCIREKYLLSPDAQEALLGVLLMARSKRKP